MSSLDIKFKNGKNAIINDLIQITNEDHIIIPKSISTVLPSSTGIINFLGQKEVISANAEDILFVEFTL